jgi:hypothetical protein
MKTIYQISLLALLVIVIPSCQKEMATVEQTTEESFSKKIENMDQYLTDFKAKMSNPLKSGEMLNMEDARWHLSALLNFSYADAKTHYEFFSVDTFYTTIPLSDQLVSINDLNDAFTVLSDFVISAYYAIESEEKTIIIAEVGIESTDNPETEVWVVLTMGYNPPYLGPSFGETDWWYWGVGGHDGFGLGKCGEYEGESVGLDASVVLTSKAMISIPVPIGRVYYTDEVTFEVHPSDYPVPINEHPFGRRSLIYWEYLLPSQPPPLENACLCPDEMNYYLNNIKFVIMPDKKPDGKVITKYWVESSIVVGYGQVPDHLHRALLTFAVENVSPYPPEL